MRRIPEGTEFSSTTGLIAGFILFVVVTFPMLLFACDRFFGCTPRRSPVIVMLTAVILFALIASLVFVGNGRSLVLGFVAGMLFFAVTTRGATTKLWLLPFGAAKSRVVGAAEPTVQASKESKQRTRWIGERKHNPIPSVLGFRMTNVVLQCADRLRRADPTGSFPRSADDLENADRCGTLIHDRIDRDSVRGRRFQLDPEIDMGWRWSYQTKPPDADGRVTGFTIRVAPDSLLEKPGPVYTSDESGLVLERLAPGMGATSVGSIARVLVALRSCMMGIPAEQQRRLALLEAQTPDRPYYGSIVRDPFDEARSLCGPLGKRISTYELDDGQAIFSLSVHDQTQEIVDIAAVHHLVYRALDGAGFSFEIRAAPTLTSRAPLGSSGVRRYYLAPDGSVHVTREMREARIDDPLVPPCELDPAMACEAPRE